ncbi:sensor domain-containing diguanylate cyclase [Halalkalibacter urbisdiaboli]|uniref:sensor domain-containing diguanylate cyclase n=1 Tax=Halalkalibacter urbisdiaboli TaxID=1960589 RepID=UPI000B43AADD|nr:sensor domain-containing diguanylate cyclase [Halalkalibacter urbisdiaboli]
MVILSFFFSFLPFLFMFAMACEVYFRSRRNRLHRLTATLLLFLSIIFLSEFLIKLVPQQEAYYFTLVLKYINAFILMTLSIYFFKTISKVEVPCWFNIFFLLPLINIFLLLWPNLFFFTLQETAVGNIENLSTPFLLVILGFTLYTFYWNLYFLIKGYRKIRYSTTSIQFQKRLQYIVKGCVLTIIAISISLPVIYIGERFGAHLSFLSPYGTLIFAYTLRHSMIHYDWLASSGHRYELLFKMSSNGIVLLDKEGRMIDANPAFCEIVEQKKADLYMKNFIDFLLSEKNNDFLDLLKASFKDAIPMKEELYLLTANGQTVVLDMVSDYIDIEDTKHAYLMLRDITSQKQYEEKLKYLAYHDPLTGLGNRTFFYEKINELLLDIEQTNSVLAVFLVDLDKFKWINDTYGHAAGDSVLQHIAKQIRLSLPKQAFAARMGGDEFAMAIPQPDDSQIVSIVEKLLNNLRVPININGTDFSISGSIGISIALKDGRDVDTLLNHSDKAMYEAKNKGKNRYCLYSTGIEKNNHLQ